MKIMYVTKAVCIDLDQQRQKADDVVNNSKALVLDNRQWTQVLWRVCFNKR